MFAKFMNERAKMIDAEHALPGRSEAMPVPGAHAALGTPLQAGPDGWPHGLQTAILAFGCFWGAERIFWQLPGVHSTAVGYSGGHTPNPTYEEVCSGATGHAESVLVVFDPSQLGYADILRTFWENHDPTQGMRQGNDVGTQYRSAIFYADDGQRQLAESSKAAFSERLQAAGYPEITTQIAPAGPFYYAEPYHQQYLEKNPGGYDCHSGTGVSCPIGLVAATE